MSKILKYAIGVNYMIVALLVLFNKDLPAFDSFPNWAKITFPIVLIIYGAFRIYRTYTNFEELSDEE